MSPLVLFRSRLYRPCLFSRMDLRCSFVLVELILIWWYPVSKMWLSSLLFAGLGATAAVPANNDPIVNLGYAKYRGTRLPSGVDQFLGMRYAKAPLGDLRFRAPQDPNKNCRIQNATQVRHFTTFFV